MEKEINQSGEMRAKVMEPENMLERVNSGDDDKEAVRDKTVTVQQYGYQPKKGSVIPAKRRLVKTLMYESIVQSVATLFSSCSLGGASASSSSTNPNISSKTVPPNNSSANVRKDHNNIFPFPP